MTNFFHVADFINAFWSITPGVALKSALQAHFLHITYNSDWYFPHLPGLDSAQSPGGFREGSKEEGGRARQCYQ